MAMFFSLFSSTVKYLLQWSADNDIPTAKEMLRGSTNSQDSHEVQHARYLQLKHEIQIPIKILTSLTLSQTTTLCNRQFQYVQLPSTFLTQNNNPCFLSWFLIPLDWTHLFSNSDLEAQVWIWNWQPPSGPHEQKGLYVIWHVSSILFHFLLVRTCQNTMNVSNKSFAFYFILLKKS